MIVRAKFFVSASGAQVAEHDTSGKAFGAITLNAAYSPNPKSENYKFFAASPGGTLTFSNVDLELREQFPVGTWWYLDFERIADGDPLPDEPYWTLQAIDNDGWNLQTRFTGVGYAGAYPVVRLSLLIQNKEVWPEYTVIGTHYKVTFRQTTREGV